MRQRMISALDRPVAERWMSPGVGGSEIGGYRNRKRAVPLPPDLVVDLGVGRDRMLAGNQRIGETDETELLLSIARGLIRAAGRDIEEADMLRLPFRQRERETVSAPWFDGVGWRRPPIEDDPAHALVRDQAYWWIVRIDRLERQDRHSRSR